ncbi:VCBS domain-containing protein [Sinobacterium norvegicum]|nr:VCBS domain-containing protein [Sinobacterium norvegicum]
MLKVVAVEGSVFFVDGSGHRVYLQQGDQLAADTVVESESPANIILQDGDGAMHSAIVSHSTALSVFIEGDVASAVEPEETGGDRSDSLEASDQLSQADAKSIDDAGADNEPPQQQAGHYHAATETVERVGLEVTVDAVSSSGGQPAAETFFDTQSQTFLADDAASASANNATLTIGGELLGSTVEDKTMTANGVMTLRGGSGQIPPQSYQGVYGVLSLAVDGHWQYRLNNGSAKVQTLAAGESVQEHFNVHAMNINGVDFNRDLTVNVSGSDDKPVIDAIFPHATVEGGRQISGQIHAVDIDHGDTQVFQTSFKHGGFSLNPDGSYHLDPTDKSFNHLAAGEHEILTVAVTVTDSQGQTDTQNLVLTVNGSNNIPVVASIATVSVAEGSSPMAGQITATDIDHGDTVTFSTPMLHPGFILNTDGSYTVDPSNKAFDHLAVGEHQTLTIPVIATDNHGENSVAKNLLITVSGTNDIPVIGSIATKVVNEGDHAITGQITSTDVDHGDTATFSTRFQHPGFVLKADGSYSIDPSDKSFDHLAAGSHETLVIPIVATDNNGAQSSAQSLTITVRGTNDLPVVGGVVAGSVIESDPLHATTQGNLTATDPDTGDTVAWGVINPQGSYGSLTVDANGRWHYQLDNQNPATNALAANQQVSESFTVTATDSSGHPVQQIITVHVTGSNDLPVISGTSTGAVLEAGSANQGVPGASGDLQVLDPDVGDQSVWAVVKPAGTYGSLTVDQNGHWSYQLDNNNPATNALAANQQVSETFSVTATDSSGQAVQQLITIQVNGSNDLPVISGTSTGAVLEAGSANLGVPGASGDLHVFDPDVGDTLAWGVAQPHGKYGTLTLDQQGHWQYSLDNSAGGAADKLAAGEHRQDSFWLTATDGSGNAVPQKIIVSVTGSNDLPVISGTATGSVTEAGTGSLGVDQAAGVLTTTDPDTGDSITWSVGQGQGTFGALTIDQQGHWQYHLDNARPSTAALTNGQPAQEVFTVSATDSSGNPVNQVITIHVTGSNDNAVITDAQTAPQLIAVTEDQGFDVHNHLHYDGHLNISDADKGEAQFDVNKGPQTLQGVGYDTQLGGHVVLNPNGDYRYTVDNQKTDIQKLGDGETLTDHVTVRSIDGTTHVISVVINGTNDNPTVSSGVVLSLGTEDTDFTLTSADLLANASDIDHNDAGQLSVHGLLASKPDGSSAGTIVDNHDGTFSFHPESNYNGPLQFTYDVQDAHGGSVAAKATTTLRPVADGAVIGGQDKASLEEFGDHASALSDMTDQSPDYHQEHQSKLFNEILSTKGHLTITDPDSGEAGFQWRPTVNGQYGHLSIWDNGNWVYEVSAGDSAAGRAIDKLGEGEELTDTMTVYSKDGTPHDIVITIHGDNDRPYCSSEVILNSGTEDTRQTITVADLLQNTVDVDHNDAGLLTIENLHADHGSIAINKDGSFSFTPEKDYSGDVHFTYDVKDAHGGVTHTGATTNLAAVGDAAVITSGATQMVTEDASGTNHEIANGHLSITDPDAGEDRFRFSQFGEQAIHDPFGGELRIDRAGVWGYSVSNSALQHLAAGQTEQVSYRVHSYDGTAHTITINVVGTNDQPTVTSQVVSATEDTAHTFTAAEFGFTDVDDGASLDHITINSVPGAAEGSLVLNGQLVHAGDTIAAADIAHLVFNPAQDVTGHIQFGFTVNDGSTDSAPAVMTLDVANVDDVSVITGDTSSAINEGDLGDTTTASGQLVITDVDQGQTPTFPDVASTATTFGHIAMVNGQWTYTLDQSKVQDLSPHDPDVAKQSVTDTYTFTASDGSTQQVSITIKGTEDAPVISSAHAAPAGSNPALGITNLEVIGPHDVSNIDPHADWGSDTSHIKHGLTIIGLYKPGSTHNELTPGSEPTLSTDHSGNGGYSRIDSHGWWQSHHIPDTTNTGSGGASGTGNAWQNGIVQFSDGSMGIINRVCDGSANGEVDYLYFHTYQNLQSGANLLSGSGVAGETISVKEGSHVIATTTVDAHGHWEVAAQGLANGQHNLHVENAQGESSAEHVYTIAGTQVDDITPAGLAADIKEDTSQTEIQGELKVTDADHNDNPTFTAQAQHAVTYGTFSIDSAGHYHFHLDNTNPVVNQLGVHQTIQETIPVVATTADGEHVQSNVVITINGSVDAPSLSATTDIAQQGSEIPLHLHASLVDTGGDHETLTVNIAGLPDHATLNHGTYNSVSKIWTVHQADLTDLKVDLQNPNFHGDLHLSITAIAEAGGETEQTSQPLTVSVNAPPEVAQALTDSRAEDSAAHSIDLLQGATDSDGDTVSIGQVSYQLNGGAAGSSIPAGLSMAPDGHTLLVSPKDAAFQHLAVGSTTTLTVTYALKDTHGGVTQQTSTISVTGTNDDPVLAVHASTHTTGLLQGTDIDDGDQQRLQYDAIQPNGHFGHLTVNGNTGAYSYQQGSSVAGMNYDPSSGTYSAKEVFEVRVADGRGGESRQFVTFDVTATVSAPVTPGGQPVITTQVLTQPTVTDTHPPTSTTQTTPPHNTVTIDLEAASDTGQSQTDDLTKDNTPTVSGVTDVPFSKVEIFDGGKLVATTTSDQNGHYQVDTSVLTEASHQLVAHATAPSATSAVTSSPLDVLIDSSIAAPTTDITDATDSGVSHTDDLTNVQNPVIIGHAEANAHVEITDQQGQVIGTAIASSTGTYSITTSTLAEGQHVLTVTATDNAGNVATASQSVDIDLTAPALARVNLRSGESSVVSLTGTTSVDTASVDIVIKHNVNQNTIEVQHVQAHLDGKGGYFVDSAQLPDGAYTAYITATDKAGNVAPVVMDRFGVDTHANAPTISFESTGTDAVYNAAEVAQGQAGTITATVHIPSDAQEGHELTVNGVSHILTAADKSHGSFTVAVEVAPGSTVTAFVTDEFGNVSATVSETAAVADTAVSALTVELTHDTGTNGSDLITNDGSLTVTGQEAGAHVEYSVDGGNTWANAFTPQTGSNTVEVRQTDPAGNTSTPTSFTFILDNQVSVPLVGLVHDTGDSHNDLITNNGSLAVVGTEANAVIEYSIDNGQHWSTSFTAVEGANNVQVRQTDGAGNVSPSAHLNFIYDSSATVSITVDSITQDNIINAAESGSSVLVTGTVGGDVKDGDTVSLLVNGHTVTGQASGGVFSIQVPGVDLAADSHLQASVTATDTAGNSNTAQTDHAYGVDVTAATVASGDAGSVTEDTVTSASGTLTATAGETIVWQAHADQTGSYGNLYFDAASGQWAYQLDHNKADSLTDSQHETERFNVVGTDAQGNTVHEQIVVQVTGTDDLPTVTGSDTGSVIEAGAANAGADEVSGILAATDVDATGAMQWSVQQGTGSYGALTIDNQGHWHYQLDNTAANTLAEGQSVKDTFNVDVTSPDGQTVTQQVVVSVQGALDRPTLSATQENTHFVPMDAEVAQSSTQQLLSNMELLGFQTQNIETNGQLDVSAASAANVTRNHSGIGVTGTGALPSNVGPAELDMGETLLLHLQGASRSASVQLASFSAGDHSYNANDKAHWIAYDAEGHKVAEGDLLPNTDPTLNGRIDIHTATPFSYIAVQAIDNPTGQGSSRFYVTHAEAQLIQYDTKVDLTGVLTDQSTTDSLSYRVSGLDAKSGFNVGTNNHDGSWTITAAQAQNLHLLHSGNLHLSIEAIASDGSIAASSTPATLDVTTQGMTYELIGGTHNAQVTEDTTQDVSEQLSIDSNAPGSHSFVAQTVSSASGVFELKADGHWTYHVNNQALQSMDSNDVVHETFTVATSSGVTREVTVDIKGVDDQTILGGQLTGSVTEDGVGNGQATGQLSLTDVDTDVASDTFVDFTPGKDGFEYTGKFGVLLVHTDGSWVYTLDNTKADALQDGQIEQEHFNKVYADNGRPYALSGEIVIDVHGSNDAAQISGKVIGAVAEDGQADASGQLHVADVDTGADGLQSEESFKVLTNQAGTNGYGAFSVDATGQWHYHLNNGDAKVQALTSQSHVTDSIMVQSADGTQQKLEVQITGADDNNHSPVVKGQWLNVDEDTDMHFSIKDFYYTDADSDALDYITITDLPDASKGSLLLNGVAVAVDQQVSAVDIQHLVYSPEHDVNGMAMFKFTANDGHVDSAEVSNIINVRPVADPLVSHDEPEDSVETAEVSVLGAAPEPQLDFSKAAELAKHDHQITNDIDHHEKAASILHDAQQGDDKPLSNLIDEHLKSQPDADKAVAAKDSNGESAANGDDKSDEHQEVVQEPAEHHDQDAGLHHSGGSANLDHLIANNDDDSQPLI